MGDIESRLVELYEIESEDLPLLRSNAFDDTKDREGSSSSVLADSLRFVGVAEYVLNGDIASFRSKLGEAANLRLQLFQRYESGDPISKSYVTMLSYKSVLDALAAGDFSLAHDLASKMGGRDSLEREYDHPFDYALGYAIRAIVLGEEVEIPERIQAFRAECVKPGNANFLPYADLFAAIATAGDADAANHSLKQLVDAHKKESKERGVFKDSEDEVLCVWGLGVANLARHRGLAVDPVPPLIPENLLVDCRN